jgi:hypothetical protein
MELAEVHHLRLGVPKTTIQSRGSKRVLTGELREHGKSPITPAAHALRSRVRMVTFARRLEMSRIAGRGATGEIGDRMVTG